MTEKEAFLCAWEGINAQRSLGDAEAIAADGRRCAIAMIPKIDLQYLSVNFRLKLIRIHDSSLNTTRPMQSWRAKMRRFAKRLGITEPLP